MYGPELEVYGLTDIGRKRKVNEDQFLVADLSKTLKIHHTSLPNAEQARLSSHHGGHVLMVADGMGGHVGGKVASTMAICGVLDYVLETMPWFLSLRQPDTDEAADELVAALQRTHASVTAEGEERPSLRQMGTTLTLGYLLWPHLFVAHAGDSRCYLVRRGNLRSITRDHTLAQEMEDNYGAKPGASSLLSHVVTRFIGGGKEDVHPDVYQVLLAPRDVLLLCSDGLNRALPDEEICRLATDATSARQLCEVLVERSVKEDGSDNVTVVALKAGGVASSDEDGEEDTAEEIC